VRSVRLAARCAVLALGALVALIGSSLGVAGTVQAAAPDLTFTATAGEANHLVVTRDATGVRLVDTGAAVTAGAGCTSVAPNEVLCSAAPLTILDITILAGDMSDFVSVVSGEFPTNARVRGEDGADILEVGAFGFNFLNGGPGMDTLRGGNEVVTNVLNGGPDADVISGGSDYDRLDYSTRMNPVTVDFDGDDGEAGEGDVIGPGINGIRGGAGNDSLFTGGSSVEDLYGGPGDDVLDARNCPTLSCSGVMIAQGGAGDDELVGGSFMDLLSGEDGADTLRGGGQHDSLRGGSGADILRGGDGGDSLFAGPGMDLLIGGNGRDRLDGRQGADVLRTRDGARVDVLDVVRELEAF
jgi:Ca2+-binding RTX toxin-like protein